MHVWYDMLLLELPDNVARVDLNCPGAPQVVVVGEGIPRREDTPCRLTLETPTTLRYMHTNTHTNEHKIHEYLQKCKLMQEEIEAHTHTSKRSYSMLKPNIETMPSECKLTEAQSLQCELMSNSLSC